MYLNILHVTWLFVSVSVFSTFLYWSCWMFHCHHCFCHGDDWNFQMKREHFYKNLFFKNGYLVKHKQFDDFFTCISMPIPNFINSLGKILQHIWIFRITFFINQNIFETLCIIFHHNLKNNNYCLHSFRSAVCLPPKKILVCIYKLTLQASVSWIW